MRKMQYEIHFKAPAQRALEKLERQARERLIEAIDSLAEDPRPAGCRKLRGKRDLYRIRVGAYRVVYQVRDEVLVVVVVAVGDRRDIYRHV